MQYLTGQLCNDGRTRKTIWYQCCPRFVLRDSAEHIAGIAKAESFAWAHVDQVLHRGGDATKVDARVGAGERNGEGRFKRHGDPTKIFASIATRGVRTLHVHPAPAFGDLLATHFNLRSSIAVLLSLCVGLVTARAFIDAWAMTRSRDEALRVKRRTGQQLLAVHLWLA